MVNEADELGLPAWAFDRQDDGADVDFYAGARFVTHIDEGALTSLTRHYASLLEPGDRVLDLMSSWVSHLPAGIDLEVVGHGMNEDELAANPRLDRWFVQDLNLDPILSEPTDGYDVALVCVGVQYLLIFTES